MSASSLPSLRAIAVALKGEVAGGQVLAPGPNHSRTDRSMTVRLSPSAPDGFLAFSHAGDDWRACRDYVREKLGIERERGFLYNVQNSSRRSRSDLVDNVREVPQVADVNVDINVDQRTLDAVGLFRESIDPIGTPAQIYFALRRLQIDNLAGRVIRWHPRIGAMIALFRNIRSGEPQAVSRTFLDAGARKIERKFLGPVGGAAIMLDGLDAVTAGLHIGEGLETCQAARQLGLRPTWALGSAGAIAAFPVLGGVECLTILGEHDDASARAVEACASRWHAAGREALINHPIGGKDLNDVIGGASA